MKKLLTVVALLLTLSGCNSLADSKPHFTSVDNSKKDYPVYNTDGTLKMVADSGFRPVIENGVRIPAKRVATSPAHVVTVQGKDSLAFVSPTATFVRETKGLEQYVNLYTIFGIVCLIGIVLVWVFWKKTPNGSFVILGQSAATLVLFFLGMQAIQKKFFDIAQNNTKQISMDTYRNYFIQGKDTTDGYKFWDSVRTHGGIVDFVKPEKR